MKNSTFKMKLIVLVLFICVPLFFNVPKASANPPTQEYCDYLFRVSYSLFESYIFTLYSPNYEEYMEANNNARQEYGGGYYQEAAATLEGLIVWLKTFQDKFFIYITADGINLLQTPSALALAQGERGYVPVLIANELEQPLTLSISSENSSNRHVSSQTINLAQGSLAYASLLMPVIDVVSTGSGQETIPVHMSIGETGDTLDTSFVTNVAALTGQANLFPYFPSRQSMESSFTTSLALADIDGDGLVDIYTGNYMQLGSDNYPKPAQNVIYYNRGKGGFQTRTLTDFNPKGTRNVATADVNGDGAVDHVIDGSINVRIDDADNVIRSFPDLDPVGLNSDTGDTVKVLAEDINLNDSDLKPQLLVSNAGDSIKLYRNNGAGGFESNTNWVSSRSYGDMALGDVDGDGIKDLAVVCGGYVRILKGNEYGGNNYWFNENEDEILWQMSGKTTNILQLLFSDLDGDGDQDFIIIAQKVYVYLNNSTPEEVILDDATGWPFEFTYQLPSCADIGDINNDGKKDIVIGFYTAYDVHKRMLGGENKVYLGKLDPSGYFTFDTVPAWSAFYSDKTIDVKLADLNQDSLLDLVVGNDGKNYIYFNSGAQVFSPVLPKDPSEFYKGNIYSQLHIVNHEPSLSFTPPADASKTIGVNADIGNINGAQALQEFYEYMGMDVAGFWSGFSSPFEGMFYFNKIDTEISAAKAGGAGVLMLFNPGTGARWQYACNNNKFIDNMETFGWGVQKFAQRYGPTGLLAKAKPEFFSSEDKVLYSAGDNEPEHGLPLTSELTVKKQNYSFDVIKEVDDNIIVTTANHGGVDWAIDNFNDVALALGLNGYYKFDIARIQTYICGLTTLGMAHDNVYWTYDEFFSFDAYNGWSMSAQAVRDLLSDPESYWSNYNYDVVSGEGNSQPAMVAGSYPGQPENYEIPYYSQAQEANYVISGYLRNIANLMPYIATGGAYDIEGVKKAVCLLIEMLQNYHYAGVQAVPETEPYDNKVIVYKFANNDDGSLLYAVRATPGHSEPTPYTFIPQTITLDFAYPDSTVVSIKNMFDGWENTGDDVVAVNENFFSLQPPLHELAERWVQIPGVIHGQYNQADLNYTVANGHITITLPNYDFYYIKEIANGTNAYPDMGQLDAGYEVDEGGELIIHLTATDPNQGDRLTFTYSPIMDNAEIVSTGLTSADFVFEPDFTQAQTYEVVFTVTDEGGLSDDSPQITITVVNVNQAPQITPLHPPAAYENAAWAFTVQATDPDEGDTLTFRADGDVPDGFDIDSATGECTWTPAYNQAGTWDFEIIVVDDGQGHLSDTEPISIVVENINQPPVLHPLVDSYLAREGVEFVLPLAARDLDEGDNLTFSGVNLPSGAVVTTTNPVSPAEGSFNWTPSFEQGGTSYTCRIIVQDGNGGEDWQWITIDVEDVNRAPNTPTTVPQGPFSVNELGTLRFRVLGSDPDGDPLTFEVHSLPQGALFNESSGQFEWTPTYSQGGVYNVYFFANDGELRSEQPLLVVITVNNTNQNPVLGPLGGPYTVAENQSITHTFTATDPDHDPVLTFSATGLPTGASITPGGLFTWTPTFSQGADPYREYTITIRVEDGQGGSADGDVVIQVTNVNRAPVLDPLPDSYTIVLGENVTIHLQGSDPDGDDITYHIAVLPPGATLNENTGVFSWTPAQARTYVLRFYALDAPYGAQSNTVQTQVIVTGGRGGR